MSIDFPRGRTLDSVGGIGIPVGAVNQWRLPEVATFHDIRTYTEYYRLRPGQTLRHVHNQTLVGRSTRTRAAHQFVRKRR